MPENECKKYVRGIDTINLAGAKTNKLTVCPLWYFRTDCCKSASGNIFGILNCRQIQSVTLLKRNSAPLQLNWAYVLIWHLFQYKTISPSAKNFPHNHHMHSTKYGSNIKMIQLTMLCNEKKSSFPSVVRFWLAAIFFTSTKFCRECGGFWH